MKTRDITQAQLKQILNYDPETGIFTWKINSGRHGRIKSGTIAGSDKQKNGYIEINFNGSLHKAHRLAVLYMTGDHPINEVDHINGIRIDNRWSNLREATLQQNKENLKIYATNTSGFPGVTWHKRVKKWQARISKGTIRLHLGYFDDKQGAHEKYIEAKKEIHKFQPAHRE